jgi:small GTP-binding protein
METPITIGTTLSSVNVQTTSDIVSDNKSLHEALNRAVKLAIELAQRHRYTAIHRRAQDLASRLKDSVLNIVVLGEFKRGKSSIINALLGAKILPTAVIPTTSVVTTIKFGNIPRACVELQSGHRFYADLEKIDEYITEDLNPNNQKGVKQVEIEYPAKLLSENVRLIDTPGIGSTYLHNTQTTRAFLEEADAVLFVFSADQPATEAELSLLKESSTFSVHTFLVQNKADQLLQEELETSKRFLEHAITKEFQGQKTKVYAVSARRVFEVAAEGSNKRIYGNLFDFCSLYTDFEAFTTHERRQFFIESAIIHARLLLTQIDANAHAKRPGGRIQFGRGCALKTAGSQDKNRLIA